MGCYLVKYIHLSSGLVHLLLELSTSFYHFSFNYSNRSSDFKIYLFLQVNKPSVIFIDEIDALATRLVVYLSRLLID